MEYDKKLHLLAGFLIMAGCSFFMSAEEALYLSFLAGLAKEVRDEYVYGGLDFKDMLSTWLGGLIGYVCTRLP